MTTGELTKLAGPLAAYEPKMLTEFKASFFFQLRMDLLWLHLKDNVVLDVDDFQDLMRFNKEYPHKHKLIMTLGSVSQITKEARDYDAAHKPDILKQATISDYLPQRIILNYMARARSSKHPLKNFSNIQKGLDWLEKD